jgi:MoaA/NifB/PqqE/SkfB family radical SAM enzyme
VYNLKDIKQVHLEISGKCNAKCPMCSRHAKNGEVQSLLTQTNLSETAFYSFFTDEFCNQIEHVYMSGVYGDPCMHPRLFDFCKHLSDRNVDVSIETNGGYRTPEFWKKLASTNILVRFAVDGLSDTNHIYRRNVRWNILEKNMRAYSDAGGRAEWNFIVFEHNEHQVDEARNFANQLNFDFRIKITQKFRSAKTWQVFENKQKIYEINPPQNEEYRHHAIADTEYNADTFYEFDMTSDKWNVYNDTEIDCKALQRNELFLSFEGYLLPCCYVGTLYNDSPSSHQVRNTLDMAKYDITKHSLEEIVNNKSQQKVNEILKLILETNYKFKIITFVHDHYSDNQDNIRDKSREYLKSKGYELLVNDVSFNYINSFEDWWVLREYIENDHFRYLSKYLNPANYVQNIFYKKLNHVNT